MSRNEFLRSLGLSSGALMAFYCLGTLTSCSKDKDSSDPQPNPSTPVDVTLDLTTTAYNPLKTVGGFAYSGNILVAHVKDGSYVALSKVCTHQGTTVEYRSGSDDVYCPAHGSVFRTTGTVANGPATQALTSYKTTLSADGNQLKITNT